MVLVERDYIMRLVQQLTQAVARILRLRELEKYDQAQLELEQACSELLGMSRELLLTLDAATAAQLLGHEERIKIAARLLQEEGELLERQSRLPEARDCRQRALEFYLEALHVSKNVEGASLAAIAELCTKVSKAELATRHQEILAGMPKDQGPCKNH